MVHAKCLIDLIRSYRTRYKSEANNHSYTKVWAWCMCMNLSCMTRQVQVLASATAYDVNAKSQLGPVTSHVAIGPND